MAGLPSSAEIRTFVFSRIEVIGNYEDAIMLTNKHGCQVYNIAASLRAF